MVKNLSDSRLLTESARGAVLLDASIHSSNWIMPSCRIRGPRLQKETLIIQVHSY